MIIRNVTSLVEDAQLVLCLHLMFFVSFQVAHLEIEGDVVGVGYGGGGECELWYNTEVVQNYIRLDPDHVYMCLYGYHCVGIRPNCSYNLNYFKITSVWTKKHHPLQVFKGGCVWKQMSRLCL